MSPSDRSQWIKQKAQNLGFLACGVAKAAFLEEEAPRLERWIRKRRHGKMTYMARHTEKRLDPRRLLPGAKSVISVLYNYTPVANLFQKKKLKIARYAYGEDYHQVVRAKLRQLLQAMRTQMGDISGRVFVDSAPVHERAWAQRAGLGWIGRNTLLLRKGVGSFFFLGEIICDLVLAEDAPATDHCGSCRACVDSCPTDALSLNGEMDASRCISYLTIELKEEIPTEISPKALSGWVFGCDICQEVCPWNRFAVPHTEPRFAPLEGLEQLPERCKSMPSDNFDKAFARSALQRAGHRKLSQNIQRAGT